jgi:hypothetical protein
MEGIPLTDEGGPTQVELTARSHRRWNHLEKSCGPCRSVPAERPGPGEHNLGKGSDP